MNLNDEWANAEKCNIFQDSCSGDFLGAEMTSRSLKVINNGMVRHRQRYTTYY